MPPRRAGAPRLIDWTGERAVPWAPDVQVIYEHYHRYFWARDLVAGLRVLDLGSGEGFGAALLADTAASVVGIDVDERTVEHSQLSYASGDVEFLVGSATDLSAFPDNSFDAVVAFEIVEHVSEQEAMLAEIKRVTTDQGFVVMSTPDRRAYTEATNEVNPFHVRELTEGEFRSLLAQHLPCIALFGQRSMTGSRIESLEQKRDGWSGFHVERAGDEWRESGPMSPKYLIAVAGAQRLPELPADSTLSDYALGLMRDAERKAAVQAAAGEQERERLTGIVGRQHGEIAALLGELELPAGGPPISDGQMTEARTLLRRLREDGEDARRWRQDLAAAQAELLETARARTALTDELRVLREEHEQSSSLMRRELQRVDESVTWNAIQGLRVRLYDALGGRQSLRARAVSRTLRLLGAAAGQRARRSAAVTTAHEEPEAKPVLVLPDFAEPVVTIVIAAHDGADLTERCLRAILASTDLPYEVIVVDDAADSATKELLASTEGISVLSNPENIGYLRSVNRGSAAARGRFIVQLNNDTEPEPGWLEALVERAMSAPDVGIVVPKLVFPDGSLQEAGAIIWQDGTGWNYGRGEDPADPAFDFVREVDYGSAAALLVRKELWEELGGFDERFAPGYYEDSDLCFAARAAGWRVVFEPASRVVHLEGASMGTDPSAGGKRFQEINRGKFVSKWAAALTEQHAGPSPGYIHLAADRRRGPFVLVIDHKVPTPDRDSGSLRMWHMLSNLVDLGYRVVFLPDNLSATEPYAAQLRGMGIQVLHGDVELPARLVGIAGETALVILCRPYVAARYLHLIREYLPQSRVAYDTVDLHYVRELGRGKLSGVANTAKADGLRELEHALSRACDVALTVSSAEAERLERDAPGVTVQVVPNANPVWETVPDRDGRAGLLFVGGFEHPPNVDAALHLAQRIMPLVWRDLPDVRLTIAGGHAPPEVLALAAPRLRVAGWVPDLEPLLASSVALVAPLRFGAGVKGKVTQSLGAGLPVVTSTLGAEGIHAVHRQHLLVADDPEAFAAEVVELMRDASLWAGLSSEGRDLIRHVSSPEAQRAALAHLAQR